MDISQTRQCNQWNLELVGRYFCDEPTAFDEYYEELLDDQRLLSELNLQMERVRGQGFTRAIFSRESLSTIDWFAFERVLMYVLVRHLQPSFVLETGVYYGGNTTFLLAGLHANEHGKLVSIDLPASQMDEAFVRDRHPDVGDSELYEDSLTPGFIVPDYLKPRWELVLGDSREVIPNRPEQFDLFVHDSEHSHEFVFNELTMVRDKLRPDGVIVADDVDWSNGFLAYCVQERLLPLLLTDNGKDKLRVRMGLTKMDHSRNRLLETTGA